jgi:hypothetical protein
VGRDGFAVKQSRRRRSENAGANRAISAHVWNASWQPLRDRGAYGVERRIAGDEKRVDRLIRRENVNTCEECRASAHRMTYEDGRAVAAKALFFART